MTVAGVAILKTARAIESGTRMSGTREQRAAWSDAPADAGPSAEELAWRAQDGSMAAFTQLVAMFEGRVFAFLVRRVGRREEAEDLTQETFIRAWRKIARFDPRRSFSTWVFTIAVRLAASHARHAGRLRRRPGRGRAAEGGGATGPADDPARVAQSNEEHARLWAIAESVLSGDQRDALWLRYAEGMDVKSIGAVLGKSQVGVRVSLLRARRALGGALADAECSEGGEP